MTAVYGTFPELERIELGERAAYTYDEPFSVAYRIGTAAGIARPEVPLRWQTDWRLK